MNLAEIRAKYPAYKDVDDQRLADALYQKYYPTADRREFDARIGLTPYQGLLEATATAIGNLPASIAESKFGIGQMLAEGVTDIIDPQVSRGRSPPLQVTPGAPIEELVTQPAAPAYRVEGTGIGKTLPDGTLSPVNLLALLPEDMRREIGEVAAKESLSQQLRKAEARKGVAPIDVAPGSVEEIVSSAGASTVEMVAPAILSVMARNPGPLVAYFAARSGGAGYNEARDAGAGTDTARAAAGLYAAAEMVTEAIAGKVLVEGGKTLVRSILKAGVAEGVTEAATEALQALVDSQVIGLDMTLEEAMNRIKVAGAAGAIAGGVIAPVTHGVRKATERPTPGIEVVPPEPVPDDVPIEDRLALPGPGTMLALPSPEQFAPAPETLVRRQPPAPVREEPRPPTEEEIDYQARIALERTRQAETAELLQTARETVTPLGTFSTEEIGEDAAGRVRQRRIQTGRPVEGPVTIDELAGARVPQKQIDAIIAERRPMTSGEVLRPADVRNAAAAKNIVYDDGNFAELAYRATGQRNVDRMTQAQLNALKTTIDSLPAHAELVTVPVAEQSPFTDDQYGKALDAIRNQGRYTAGAIKDATGLRNDKDVRAIRDAMVRRGQLVQRGKNDYRLYDVLGEERQSTPRDLPPGAFKEHVIRRTPVGKVRVRVDGKSVGTFGSGSEARVEVSRLRESKGPKAQIAIEPAEETAWGVFENRYDAEGNLLGQVVVDTHRDETAARKAADELNAPPDTGARYTSTVVSPGGSPRLDARPARQVPTPEALAGRLPEILKRLNQQARDRKLPLLGVRVQVKSTIKTPEGEGIEGQYFRKLMQLTAQNLTADMTTDEIVERLGQVMDHEMIHALRETGVLGPETTGWKSIVRYAKRAKRPNSNETYVEWARRVYTGVPGYADPTTIEEEAIAEAFRHWAANKRNVVGQPATVFRQIVEWFKRLFNAIPTDVFEAIETGRMVEEALTPPGSNQPRARATRTMQETSAEAIAAQEAQDENLARIKSREYLRARAQAREDRFGRSGPKTVLGTTPSRAYETGELAPTEAVRAIADKYRSDNGLTENRLMTYLPEDVDYLMRVADAQQRAAHDPGNNAVAKAYRALIDETRRMWNALGVVEVEAWNGDGAPYASPAALFEDIAGGRVKMRLSNDMFGQGADNLGHPLYAASGVKTADGQDVTFNDMLRVVHDVYGHGQSGYRDGPRGQYNAYHEHARLLSPEARRALATETLAQSAWANYGPHLRRRDGTVPRETDIDYLKPNLKEFAEQKAFLLDEELVTADPGWALAEAAGEAVEDAPRFSKVAPLESLRSYRGRGDVDTANFTDLSNAPEIAPLVASLEAAATARQAHAAADAWVLEQGLATDAEHMVLFDQQGGLVAAGLGTTGNVGFPSYADRAFRDGLLRYGTHNHPTNNGFSTLDVLVTLAGRAVNAEQGNPPFVLTAMGSRGARMSAEAGPAFVGDPVKNWSGVGVLLAQMEMPLRRRLQEMINRREVSIETARATHHHLQNQLLHRVGVIDLRSNGLDIVNDTIPGAENIVRDLEREVRYAARRSRLELAASRDFDGSRQPGGVAEPGSGGLGPDGLPAGMPAPSGGGRRYSKFDDSLPGGRLYGNKNRSPGGALSAPGTPTPAFSWPRPGNAFFGGEMAEEQLRMVREGDRGATMIYLTPDDYLALAGAEANPEQEVYDAAIEAGYKLSGLPSLVTSGYAGNVRAVAGDSTAGAQALVGRADKIPVILYPKDEQSLGLVTALEAPDGTRVPWPHEGRAENFPDERPDGGPKYSMNAPFGTRLPNTPPGPLHNIVQQRTETAVGRFLKSLGRSRKSVLGLPSIFDLRTKLQDKMLSWKEVEEYANEHGGSIDDINDAYMLEQLYHGKVFDQIRRRELDLQMPLLDALKAAHDGPRKITPKNFEDYLYARHAPERNAYLRARGAKAPNPSGMSDAEAAAALDRFALDGKLPELENLARLADAITADTTRTRVAAGLISEAAAAASPYQYYVPLRGFTEEDLDPDNPVEQTRARSGKGFSVGGREDRAVTGRERKAGDILGHLLLQNTEAVIRAQKNEVALAAMRFVQDNAQLGVGTILATAPTRRVIGANGMITEAGDPTYRQQPDIITAKWKGKEIIARLNDPRLARAIKSDYVSTSNDLVNAMVAVAGRINRYLATVNTSLNPEFLISNLARDMQTAGILAAQFDIKSFGRKIIGDAPKAMLGIREVLRNDTATTPWAEAFREMQQAGGTTEFLGIHDLSTQVNRIRRSVTQTGLNATPRKAMEYLGKVFKFVDDYNKVAENAFRLSAYVHAREAGVSIPKAAYLAKNLTVNFNKGGEMKGFMNSMYLFYNASVQGSFVLLNGLKNKRVQKIVAGVVTAGVLQDIINRMISGDEDDNGVTDYDDIPDYVLETNFVLMDPLGILKSLGIEQGYFALPMPYGFNAFYNLGRNVSAAASGSPVRSWGKSMTDSLLGFLDAFNPLGGVQSVWNFLAPTFADPAVDLITNKDYAGNSIVPDRYDIAPGVPMPDSQKHWSNTSDIPVWVAEHLNRLTGGNEVRKGAVDISPETLQYGFDYAFGAMGKFAERTGKFAFETTPEMLRGDFEDIEIGDIPFARRVVGSVGSRGNTERYYEVAREIKTVAEEIELFQKTGRIDELRDLVASKPIEVRLIGTFADAEKTLKGLSKQLRDLRANDAVPADRRREIEQQIKEAQDRIMAQLNRLYFDQKKTAAR